MIVPTMRTLESADGRQNGPSIVGFVKVGISSFAAVFRARQAGVFEVVLVKAQHERWRRQQEYYDGHHGHMEAVCL